MMLSAHSFVFSSQLLLLLWLRNSKAFFIQTSLQPPRVALSMIQNNDNDDPEIAMERNEQRTCIKQFLTQRSIQSFMFLAEQVRDPHTADWVERLLGKSDLLNYHGTGAFDITKYPAWDSFFLELIQQPKTSIIIQAKRRGRGHGGWSKNNPYLKDRYVEYEVKIDPENLLPRIMAVREQLANEFVTDVDSVRIANDQILDSYDETVVGGSTTKAFDRMAYTILMDKIAMDNALDKFNSSPFRKGSFDLLQLLSLQEAIHRTLREYMSLGESKEVSFQFLRDFYINRLSSHFDGYQQYGRADDFLEELLLTMPSVKTLDGHMEFTDPVSIAKDIIDERSEVLLNWKDEMIRVPDDHISLRKVMWTKQMTSMGEMGGEVSSPQSVTVDEGAFE
eukprot:CAMPEP_0203666734 /NCGR_PEP_ID=MMETSP0090-20130426/3733_1 /ASSEMBLY_ACC=CAM_ASM_001088 /TAXON_ID=426623 /ORGANISM="Chaetoceros affinis, Strain CCMP159" /LENGTH=391 /DNA_ID=CAMNT_0050530711 /DNA_START=46 /DNA_END=1221 /DNA_ORIENTATION=-